MSGGLVIKDGKPIDLEKIAKCSLPLGMKDQPYGGGYLRGEVNKRIVKLLKKHGKVFTLESLNKIFKEKDLPISAEEFIGQGEFKTHHMRFYMNENYTPKGDKVYRLMNVTGYGPDVD